MRKSIPLKIFIPLICFTIAASTAITAMLFSFVVIPSREGNLYKYNQKMLEVKALVDEYYTGEIDEEYLAQCLSMGYVAGLNDRYADYITPEEAEESMNSLYGLNTGIGVQVTAHPDNKTVLILDVHADSPAEKAGLMSRDEMVSLDGQSVADLGYSGALSYISSVPMGNFITIGVQRGEKLLEFKVELTQYIAQTVFAKSIDGIAYIQITGFNDKTVDQFIIAVDSAVENGALGIVFDLRGNGGGTLLSVYHMLDYLLPKGLLIEVKYKNPSNSQVYYSDEDEIDLPMAVLTDENTASASELFSQSLKDYKKAVTIGRNTYGKGVVQRTFELSDGSLVRFTVAKYYTANGSCLDGIGVEPDIPVEWTDEELTYRLINGIEVDKDFLAAKSYILSQLS